MKAVILAGKSNPKLKPFSDTRHESMIHVGGKYILEKIIRRLARCGIQEVILVVNHHQNRIRSHFSGGEDFGVKIRYAEQKQINGIGNALFLCKDFIDNQPFLLIYGDVITVEDHYRQILRYFRESSYDYIAAIAHPVIPMEKYGNVYIDHGMKITQLLEKSPESRGLNYVLAGCYILSPGFFDVLSANDNNMEASLQALIGERKIFSSLWEESWLDIDAPWHILPAAKFLMQEYSTNIIPASCEISSNVILKNGVVLGEGVVIKEGTTILGPCYIGDSSFIGNNCLIRGFSSIGKNSVIGFGSEIKNSVLFGNTKIGRLSFIGDSVVGENVELGSGTITINNYSENSPIFLETGNQASQIPLKKAGAFIGDNCRIGSNQTLRPGLCVPSGTVISDHITVQKI